LRCKRLQETGPHRAREHPAATQRKDSWLRGVLRLAGEKRPRDGAARLFGITGLAHEPAGNLSYGQRKLLELASLLVADPAIPLGSNRDRIMTPVRNVVTIRDVARVAKVHPGTVSRALNAQTRALVNQETADRVMRAAEQLGYRPNPIARGLKTNHSYTIGVLIPDITNPLFPPILRGIEDRLDDAGYTALIVNTDNDAERERSHMEAMRARQVDGFISATARLDRELLSDVAAGGTPLVLVNRSLEDGSVPAVTVNDRQGIRLAVEHVAGLGHKRIGHVAGPQNISTGHRRHLGFLEAMQAMGLAAPAECVRFSASFIESEGARVYAELLDAADELTAIVAANDRLAIGCYDVLEARGLRCPQDISIVGFNDMPFVDRLRPPLTSVRVPQREIGTAAADLLLQRLGDGSQTGREVLLEPTLVIRGSTAAPHRRRSAR
jgi:LacI family transcriptional regulator